MKRTRESLMTLDALTSTPDVELSLRQNIRTLIGMRGNISRPVQTLETSIIGNVVTI